MVVVMDPTSNLEEQRRIAARLIACCDAQHGLERCDCPRDGVRLAELVQALDEWITGRGFLPAPWGAHWRGVRS